MIDGDVKKIQQQNTMTDNYSDAMVNDTVKVTRKSEAAQYTHTHTLSVQSTVSRAACI